MHGMTRLLWACLQAGVYFEKLKPYLEKVRARASRELQADVDAGLGMDMHCRHRAPRSIGHLMRIGILKLKRCALRWHRQQMWWTKSRRT